MNALLLIDLQNDFIRGGALPVPKGEEIIPLINEMIQYPFDVIVATKDWHPAVHSSFAVNHEGHKSGDRIVWRGLEQTLWPVHCVEGTQGAEFIPGWDCALVDKVIYKGLNPQVDSYSAFFDNGHILATGLEDYLRGKGVKTIFFAGVATDYCVKYSVLDALELGFLAYVIKDACRGVNLEPKDCLNAFHVMQERGATLLSFKEMSQMVN